jgi:RNA polymerase sigma factor (sigma-70 family)
MSVLQRRRVESFLVEARPWALRQARRKYPHLPSDLYEDVYQQACVEMLRGNPRASDRPGLYAYLSRVLTGVLGRVHKQWCHQHVDLDDDAHPIELADNSFSPDDTVDNRQLSAVLNELMNRSLLAPERAVLQLQIGVGLDPDQVKEALGMSDRQYKRRRYEGVQKLRESLEDYMSGRVCAEHASSIALAASGELSAGGLEQLNAHLAHCGGCRAEIRDLRHTVRSRLALSPWPLLISAPSILATKAAAVVAVVKGGGLLGGVKGAAAVLAASAAVAGGAIAVTSGGDEKPAPAGPATAAPAAAGQPASTSTSASKPAGAKEPDKDTQGSTGTAKDRTPASGSGNAAVTPASTGSGGSAQQPANAPDAAAGSDLGKTVKDTTGKVNDTIRDTVETVRDTTQGAVDQIQQTAPELPAPADKTVDKVQNTVDDALAPLP